MKVKVLITAAGMGKRFGALTRQTNKCLLSVAGKPLLRDILESFEGVPSRDMYVVTGYQARRVENAIKDLARTLYNPFYSVSGILGSFWAARHALRGHPLIFTTSDHFFAPEVLRACRRKTAHIRVVVQKKKAYTREDAKVIIRGSRVVNMSKELNPREAHGEFGGMVYLGARASKLFFDELRNHFDHYGLHGYMMDVLLKISHKHSIPILYTLCEEGSRIEIDSVHDLIAARRLAANLKKER